MKRILIVDDEVELQNLLSVYITEKTEYKVYTAEDGEIALDQMKNTVPDLIILDVMLPRINGIAFLKDLRKMEETKDIPVILMSGIMVDEGFKEEGFILGAVDYIEKPLDLEYLVERINSILSPEPEEEEEKE